MGLPASPVVLCGDASEKGYALHVCRATAEEARREINYKEKWRFQLHDPPFTELGPEPPTAWEPLRLLDTQNAK